MLRRSAADARVSDSSSRWPGQPTQPRRVLAQQELLEAVQEVLLQRPARARELLAQAVGVRLQAEVLARQDFQVDRVW